MTLQEKQEWMRAKQRGECYQGQPYEAAGRGARGFEPLPFGRSGAPRLGPEQVLRRWKKSVAAPRVLRNSRPRTPFEDLTVADKLAIAGNEEVVAQHDRVESIRQRWLNRYWESRESR